MLVPVEILVPDDVTRTAAGRRGRYGMTRPPAPSGQVQGLPIGWAGGRTQTPCDVWQ